MQMVDCPYMGFFDPSSLTKIRLQTNKSHKLKKFCFSKWHNVFYLGFVVTSQKHWHFYWNAFQPGKRTSKRLESKTKHYSLCANVKVCDDFVSITSRSDIRFTKHYRRISCDLWFVWRTTKEKNIVYLFFGGSGKLIKRLKTNKNRLNSETIRILWRFSVSVVKYGSRVRTCFSSSGKCKTNRGHSNCAFHLALHRLSRTNNSHWFFFVLLATCASRLQSFDTTYGNQFSLIYIFIETRSTLQIDR